MKKVHLEQQMLNINQKELKFEKDISVRMDQQDKILISQWNNCKVTWKP